MGLLDPQALEYFGLLGQSMLAGQSPNAGVNIGNAMMYADTETRKRAADKARLEEEKQQAKIRDMQMQEMVRKDNFRKALSSGYQPGTAPVPFNDAMGDGSGGMIPGRAPSMDFGAAMQADPLAGFQAQKQWQEMNAKDGPQYKEVNGRLVATYPNGTVKEVYAAPEKSKFQKGDTRVIKSGRVEITQEWDGSQWKQLAKSSMDKPEGEAKPHYDPAMGGYVYPPKNGQAPSFVPVPGAPKKPEKPLTESQAKASAFLGQMREANAVINNLNSAGFSGGGAQQIPLTMATSGMDANSLTGKAMGALANATVGQTETGKQAQKYGQAQEQWAEAFLRFKTGAAATESEVRRNIRTFFPQPGDSDELIQQKESMRSNAERDMSVAAGTGADKIPQPMTMRPQSASKSSGWGMKRLE